MSFFGRSHHDYLKRRRFHPLLITLLIIAGGLALYFLVKGVFFGDTGSDAEIRLLMPSHNTLYVQFKGSSEYTPVMKSPVKILPNETIQSRNTANAYIEFYDGSTVFLDQKTELVVERSLDHKGGAREIALKLIAGQMWGDIKQSMNPRSLFEIQLSPTIFLTTKNAKFSVNYEESVVKVSDGSVRISKRDKDTEVFFQDLGVGQQFFYGGNIEENALAILMEDPWFTAHKSGDFSLSSSSESTVGGNGDTPPTGTTPDPIQILVPGKNSSTVFVSADAQEISGLVPSTSEKVFVNDYELTKYAAGTTNFKYTASVGFENLKKGKNLFTVKALGDNAVVLGTAEITIIYDPDGNFEQYGETGGTSTTAGTTETGNTETTAAGTFAIKSPNNGDNYSAPDLSGVDVKGIAPSNAHRIDVNGYTLSKFSSGDESWLYKVRTELGNLEAGKENVYEAKVYDKDGNLIGQDFITITFPAGTSAPSTTESEPEVLEPSGVVTTEAERT